MQIDKNRQNRT